MYKDILRSIDGITIYPIISLFIFVGFFVVLIIWMFKMDKKFINKMKMLPFDKEDIEGFKSTGEINEIKS